MSAQLLVCKFAVFTCVSFFFFLPMPRVSRMARWLADCEDPRSRVSREIFNDLNFKMQLIQGKFQWAVLIFGIWLTM